jgi:hypothetical protein
MRSQLADGSAMPGGYAGIANALGTTRSRLSLGQRNSEINAPRFFGSSRICFASLEKSECNPRLTGEEAL